MARRLVSVKEDNGFNILSTETTKTRTKAEGAILEVRESPMNPPALEIDYPERQTITTSEATMKASGSTNIEQNMGPCGHYPAKGKSVAVDCILPSGVQIDCAECLQNFMKQADILFTIFQLTFQEQDAERAAHSTPKVDTIQGRGITMDRNTLDGDLLENLPVQEAIPPIQHSSKQTTVAKRKGKSARGRLRWNGRFMPRSAFEALANPESKIAEGGTEQPQPSAGAGEQINLNDTSVETSTPADSLAKQKETLPEESIYVRDKDIYVKAPESSKASTYSQPTRMNVPPVTALPPRVEEGIQDSTIHVSNGTTAMSQNTSTSYLASPPTLALQERNPRKRSLTEKARELLATADVVESEIASKQAGKLASTTPADGGGTTQADVDSVLTDQNIASCPMEPPSSKRKGLQYCGQSPTKRQKTPDILSQPPAVKRRPGRPRKPRPGDETSSMISVGPSTITPDAEGSVSSRSVTTRSASMGSFQQSPTSPKYGPEFLLAYNSTVNKLPAIPIAPAAVSTPEPEKRRRGRPPKVPVEKSIPIAPVPIQPKPVVNGDLSITAADVSSGIGYSSQLPAPSEPKKRGRPRKPQITLDRSPVVAPVSLPNASTGRSLAIPSASLHSPTIPASDALDTSNLTVLSNDTVAVEGAESSRAAAPPTAGPTRMMPFSPQKRHINLIVRDSVKVLHKEPRSTETDNLFAPQARIKNTDPARSTAVNGVPKATAPVTSSPLACVVQNESTLNHPRIPPRPASIAEAVRNISTDSEPSSSSTSEDDTEADKTFNPKQSWGSGSVGARGRGRGRGSTPVASGSTRVSAAVKVEKGQQTLGSFFLKPLAVGVPFQQPAMPAAGIERGGLVEKRGIKREIGTVRVKIEDADGDVEMKDE
ncbi:hypothetical protein BGX38DRAFT_1273265 [Terfezia claveryi]|nr:hypothetical protein BGX38DRAFT_1273265 [Terfezia claveryi]